MSSAPSSRVPALLGGEPLFEVPLHVGRPNLGSREGFLEKVNSIWDRNWLTNDGPLVREFEQRVANQLQVEHCVAVSNATIGLEIAIRALDLTGEVIVPAFTFVATAHAVSWQGLQPVFCDVNPVTHQIEPTSVAAAITDRTSGIIGVHLWGRTAPVEELTELANDRNLKLLFDAAHAFGCEYGGKPVGGFGNAEVFSFHATKFVNCGEGGAITTNCSRLAEKLRLMRNFGFNGFDRVIHPGTNGKMSEFHASMGLTSLDAMDEFVKRNTKNLHAYREELRNVPGLSFTPQTLDQSNDQYVVLTIHPETAGMSRDELLLVLHSENIIARRYFFPSCHRMAPYAGETQHTPVALTATESISNQVLQLPTGMQVDEKIIARIASIIRDALACPERLRRALQEYAQHQSKVWALESQT
ncbi:MAG: DegT/DnrJ/EryC1/StrS family aminotransferase [Planctomycetaceae bacterium]